jgi:hypothetical protein
MDGVTCNFSKAASEKIGMNIESAAFSNMAQGPRNKKYAEACDTVEFWTALEPMPDFNTYWGYIKYWNPSILSAYPMWSKEARSVAVIGKKNWLRAHVMIPSDRIHIVERKDKQKFAINSDTKEPNILIDDKQQNIDEWTRKGGIGIFHKDAKTTIKRLKELGYKK